MQFDQPVEDRCVVDAAALEDDDWLVLERVVTSERALRIVNGVDVHDRRVRRAHRAAHFRRRTWLTAQRRARMPARQLLRTTFVARQTLTRNVTRKIAAATMRALPTAHLQARPSIARLSALVKTGEDARRAGALGVAEAHGLAGVPAQERLVADHGARRMQHHFVQPCALLELRAPPAYRLAMMTTLKQHSTLVRALTFTPNFRGLVT